MLRLALCVVVVFALGCVAGERVAVVPVSAFEGFQFTKECSAIDATHSKCDGVVVQHKAMVEYVQPKQRLSLSGKLKCTPEQ